MKNTAVLFRTIFYKSTTEETMMTIYFARTAPEKNMVTINSNKGGTNQLILIRVVEQNTHDKYLKLLESREKKSKLHILF